MAQNFLGYRRLKVFLFFFLAAYALGSMALLPFPRSREATALFPLFPWDMFSLVPNRQTRCALLVHRLGPRRFRAPAPIWELSGLKRPKTHLFYLTQEMCQTRLHGLSGHAELVRRELERAMPRPWDYELVQEDYDPLERWKTGACRRTSLGRFLSAGS